MITETLLNSLKSLFSSLGAKTSDNNYAVGLFDKTNGEPKGMMGMSDLASVLGEVKSETITDFDLAPLNRLIFVIGTNVQHAPYQGNVRGYSVRWLVSGYLFQILYDSQNDTIYYRGKSGTWKLVTTT